MLPERHAFHELGGDESIFVYAPYFIDSQDVRVIESGRGSGFQDEAFEPVWILGDVGREELESHRAAELDVLSSVHLTHTTRTDLVDDAITGQRSSGG